jgi:hypothetical protein
MEQCTLFRALLNSRGNMSNAQYTLEWTEYNCVIFRVAHLHKRS